MAALIALAALGLLATGAIAGLVGVVSVAIRREETSLTLTRQATGAVIRVGRWLNRVYVRVPRGAAVRRVTELGTRLPRPGCRARSRPRTDGTPGSRHPAWRCPSAARRRGANRPPDTPDHPHCQKEIVTNRIHVHARRLAGLLAGLAGAPCWP